MGNGMIVYVTLPGFQKEPIYIPTDATLADFCRAVFDKTGVMLFNGFGFKNLTTGATYTVPKEAAIINVKPDVYDNTGALTTVAKDLSASVIDSDNGTETILSAIGITQGVTLVCFSLAATTEAQKDLQQLNASL